MSSYQSHSSNRTGELNKELLNYLASRAGVLNSSNSCGSGSSSISSSASSTSTSSSRRAAAAAAGIPLEIRDLPDSIRDMIDVLVEDGKELEWSHLADMDSLIRHEASDERSQGKAGGHIGNFGDADVQPGNDAGNESGIGSDSDSGNIQLEKFTGVTPFMGPQSLGDCVTSFLNCDITPSDVTNLSYLTSSADPRCTPTPSDMNSSISSLIIPPPPPQVFLHLPSPSHCVISTPNPAYREEDKTNDFEPEFILPPLEFLPSTPQSSVDDSYKVCMTSDQEDVIFSDCWGRLKHSRSGNVEQGLQSYDSSFSTNNNKALPSWYTSCNVSIVNHSDIVREKNSTNFRSNDLVNDSDKESGRGYSCGHHYRDSVSRLEDVKENEFEEEIADDDDEDTLLQSILKKAASTKSSCEDYTKKTQSRCQAKKETANPHAANEAPTITESTEFRSVHSKPNLIEFESSGTSVPRIRITVDDIDSDRMKTMAMPSSNLLNGRVKQLSTSELNLSSTSPLLNFCNRNSFSIVEELNSPYVSDNSPDDSSKKSNNENFSTPQIQNRSSQMTSGESVFGFATLRGDRKGYVKQYNFDKVKSQSLLALNETTVAKSATLPTRGLNPLKNKTFYQEMAENSYEPITAYRTPEQTSKMDILRSKLPFSKAQWLTRNSAELRQSGSDSGCGTPEDECEVLRSDYFKNSSSTSSSSSKDDKTFLNVGTAKGRHSQSRFSGILEIMPTVFESAAVERDVECPTSTTKSFNTFLGDIKPIPWDDEDSVSSNLIKKKSPETLSHQRVRSTDDVNISYTRRSVNSWTTNRSVSLDSEAPKSRRSLGISVPVPNVPVVGCPTVPCKPTVPQKSVKDLSQTVKLTRDIAKKDIPSTDSSETVKSLLNRSEIGKLAKDAVEYTCSKQSRYPMKTDSEESLLSGPRVKGDKIDGSGSTCSRRSSGSSVTSLSSASSRSANMSDSVGSGFNAARSENKTSIVTRITDKNIVNFQNTFTYSSNIAPSVEQESSTSFMNHNYQSPQCSKQISTSVSNPEFISNNRSQQSSTATDDISSIMAALADVENLLQKLKVLEDDVSVPGRCPGYDAEYNSLSCDGKRKKKEVLLASSRRLVTNCKAVVGGATRSRDDFNSALIPAVYTMTRVIDSCREMITPTSGLAFSIKYNLIKSVTAICEQFKSTCLAALRLFEVVTLSASSISSYEDRNHDLALERLMAEAKLMAQLLASHMNFLKSIEFIDSDEVEMVSERL